MVLIEYIYLTSKLQSHDNLLLPSAKSSLTYPVLSSVAGKWNFLCICCTVTKRVVTAHCSMIPFSLYKPPIKEFYSVFTSDVC